MLAAMTRGKTLDEVRTRLDDLPTQERNLADAIVQTALRHYGEITETLAHYMKRPLPLRPHIAHALLVCGAAQILFMKVPAHAAIDETVAATGRREQPFRGLINAVLRKIAKAQETDMLPPMDATANLPDWMRARFEAAYGRDKTAAFCASHIRGADLDLAFKNPAKAAAWAASQEAEILTPTHIRVRKPGAVTRLKDYQKGDWFVQDVAAGFPAAILLDALPDTAHVLDLCAAPGGKTAQLAAAGHDVTALDISAARLQRVQENLSRLTLTAQLVTADALEWTPETKFDAIMLDPPCSASGTLRRHPDLALNRSANYISKLAGLQAALLDRAWGWLKKDGLLCYAVCSLDPMEGEAQAVDFLSRHATARALVPQGVPRDFVFDTHLRTTPADWSAQGGMDGFFAALFQKTSE